MSTANTDKKVKKSRPIKGVVSSAKMDKSRVATVERTVKHAEFGKFIKRQTKIMFHDEKNVSKEGDVVLLTPARPRSARKRFDLLTVVNKTTK